MIIGIWIEDPEAAKLANWHTYALMFHPPQIAHRFLFKIKVSVVLEAVKRNSWALELHLRSCKAREVPVVLEAVVQSSWALELVGCLEPPN
eukprot:5564507-Heterocapsa_arctica.AAC.1